jgi:hypothetical protein
MLSPTAEKPTASPTPNSNLVDRIASFIERFVFLKDKALYRLLALWIIHTYLMDEFDHTGYVFAHSPEPESGKTRLLEILDVLVFGSSQILTSPTEAALFHTAKGRTQLLDEVDTWTNRDYLKGILNAGSRRGGVVVRMEKNNRQAQYKSQEFPVFGARALSGIGMHILAEATRSRTFSIAMVRQTKGERRERFRTRSIKPEAARLVEEIKAWIQFNRAAVVARYGLGFVYLERFADRTMDVSEPLAAVLEVAYKDSPDLNRARIELLHAIAITRAERTEVSADHCILEALSRVAETEDPLIGSASELAERCGKFGVKYDEYDVSRALRAYGFESRSIRKDDGSKRRYSLSRVELTEIFQRYVCGGHQTDLNAVTTQPTTPEVLETVGT